MVKKTPEVLLEEINKSLDLLLDADAQIGDVWKMPTPHDSVRFAVTEVGETAREVLLDTMSKYGQTVNADINSEKKGYARNNVQTSANIAKELADVGMMILKYFLSREKEEDVVSAKEVIWKEGRIYISDDGIVYVPQPVAEAVEKAKESGIDPDVVSIIGMLLSYGMMLTKTGGNTMADAVLAGALFLVVTHEVFQETSFYSYLQEKIKRTIDKVKNREMYRA